MLIKLNSSLINLRYIILSKSNLNLKPSHNFTTDVRCRWN